MQKIIPSLPSGMRDLSPKDIFERKYILKNIKNVLNINGYEEIETSSIEKFSILTKKYGDETNKLIFKILNSGDFLKKCKDDDFLHYKNLEKKIIDKALRYDLTVPLARYIAKNREDCVLPFKRYQIQPVWRADRPQKGRFREFLQCDMDIVGSESVLCEFEIISMIYKTLLDFKIFDFKIKINHRKMFKAFFQQNNLLKKENKILKIFDSIDKVGLLNGLNELQKILNEKNYEFFKEILYVNEYEFEAQLKKLTEIFTINTNDKDKDSLLFKNSIIELRALFSYLKNTDHDLSKIVLDTSIVRGLDYYDGIIFEVIINESKDIGSIGGGGRYNNLVSLFSKEDIPAVGFSFGIDRLWHVLKKSNLLPKYSSTFKILITNLEKDLIQELIKINTLIKKLKISSFIYYDISSLKKQLKYANIKCIPYVLIYGREEKNKKIIILKDMNTGKQKNISIKNIESILKFIDI